MSSEVLGRDIEEVREKVERMRKDKESKEGPEIRQAREKVVLCYKEKEGKPLDCWREVEAFKNEVSKLEKVGLRDGSVCCECMLIPGIRQIAPIRTANEA